MRSFAWLLVVVGGCVASIDGGVLQQPTLSPKGGSVTGHVGIGGGGVSTSPYMLAIDLDTRVDVASGGSRWTAGASALGGIKIVPSFFLDARIGIWRAIVSGAPEASAVPSFELGGFVPLRERFDKKHPEHGADSSGVVFGVREDLDELNYFTVFVGYAIFILPGY
ncbi:MAG TPA: hypothetical protein VMZ53_11865 [Kofleriaceae bacterium]|nr:hypothetical protein [Kofleriaceae bacterium]